jgi:hypothetical protein
MCVCVCVRVDPWCCFMCCFMCCSSYEDFGPRSLCLALSTHALGDSGPNYSTGQEVGISVSNNMLQQHADMYTHKAHTHTHLYLHMHAHILWHSSIQSRRDDDTSSPGKFRHPTWNQEFQFLVEDPQTQVLISVCCPVRLPVVMIAVWRACSVLGILPWSCSKYY